MNRMLASSLSALNGLTAMLIIAALSFGGSRLMADPIAGALLGAAIGIIIAALTCGAIALLVLIERHLANMARHPEARELPDTTPPL